VTSAAIAVQRREFVLTAFSWLHTLLYLLSATLLYRSIMWQNGNTDTRSKSEILSWLPTKIELIAEQLMNQNTVNKFVTAHAGAEPRIMGIVPLNNYSARWRLVLIRMLNWMALKKAA